MINSYQLSCWVTFSLSALRFPTHIRTFQPNEISEKLNSIFKNVHLTLLISKWWFRVVFFIQTSIIYGNCQLLSELQPMNTQQEREKGKTKISYQWHPSVRMTTALSLDQLRIHRQWVTRRITRKRRWLMVPTVWGLNQNCWRCFVSGHSPPTTRRHKFKLSKEKEEGRKLEDLIFRYEVADDTPAGKHWRYRFLQAKHK